MKNVLLILLFSINLNVIAQERLYVGTGVNAFTNKVYLPIYEEFERKTGIKIHRVRLNDIKLLDDKNAWYTAKGIPLDVINGQLTQRLTNYYHQGLILPITDFWHSNELDKGFSHLKQQSTYENEILGLPYTRLSWQFYYIKSNEKDFLLPPENINDFISTCQQMTKAGITPIYIMAKSPWLQMIWFEYIALRTYGLIYFNQLMKGELSYESKEVKHILTIWQQLIDAGCFNEQYGEMSINEALPFFFRGKIGMLLTGRSILPSAGSKHKNLSYFSFPEIADISRYESVPINAFHLSALSLANRATLYKFLHFMSQAHIQEAISHPYGTVPAHAMSKKAEGKYAQGLADIVLSAADTSNFIDRILKPEFEVASRQYFTDFVRKPNVALFMKQLESLRRQHYLQ